MSTNWAKPRSDIAVFILAAVARGVLWQTGAMPGKEVITTAITVVVAAFAAGAVAASAAVAETESRLAALKPLPKADRSRYPKIIDLCRQDAQCDQYRMALAQLGRELTIGEADMIEDWVANANTRQKAQERRQA